MPMDGASIFLILAVVYFGLFYFLKIRPDRRRRKEKQDVKKTLTPGDEITMIDGIVGTVCAVKEGTVVVETGADRVRLEYAKWGILEKGVTIVSDANGDPR